MGHVITRLLDGVFFYHLHPRFLPSYVPCAKRTRSPNVPYSLSHIHVINGQVIRDFLLSRTLLAYFNFRTHTPQAGPQVSVRRAIAILQGMNLLKEASSYHTAPSTRYARNQRLCLCRPYLAHI